MVARTITGDLIAANTITANELSSITVSASKNIKVGTAAISGTTMTGSGAILNGDGTAAIGNSTTNITFNGTQITLNGNVVNTSNIAPNAITNSVYASKASVTNLTGSTWTNVLSVTITTSGGPLLITTNGNQVVGYDSGTASPSAPYFRLVRDSTVLVTKLIPSGSGVYGSCDASISYAETPSSGTYTYRLQGNGASVDFDPGVEISFISVTELKR
jgi:hypothetical protein